MDRIHAAKTGCPIHARFLRMSGIKPHLQVTPNEELTSNLFAMTTLEAHAPCNGTNILD
jgi:hypothetical protein